MEKFLSLLHEGKHSLLIYKTGITHPFDGHGISDLYNLLIKREDLLLGSVVADRIVGKAAAAIIILGGVRALYANVISTPALNMLNDSGVETHYDNEVPDILGKNGGIYPLEQLCHDCNTATKCFPYIRDFLTTSS